MCWILVDYLWRIGLDGGNLQARGNRNGGKDGWER